MRVGGFDSPESVPPVGIRPPSRNFVATPLVAVVVEVETETDAFEGRRSVVGLSQSLKFRRLCSLDHKGDAQMGK